MRPAMFDALPCKKKIQGLSGAAPEDAAEDARMIQINCRGPVGPGTAISSNGGDGLKDPIGWPATNTSCVSLAISQTIAAP